MTQSLWEPDVTRTQSLPDPVPVPGPEAGRKPEGRPMKIGVLIHDLQGGGAEAVTRSWMAQLKGQGHEVVLLVYGPEASGSQAEGRIPVSVFPLRSSAARWTVLPWWVAREARRLGVDVVLSVLDFSNIVALLGTVASSRPVVISEHAVPSLHWRHKGLSGRVKYAAARLLYRRAVSAVAVSHAVATDLRVRLGMKGEQIVVLANPVLPAEGALVRTRELLPVVNGLEPRRLLVVGRCAPEKRMDRALEVLGELRRRGLGWTCTVVGDGPMRVRLETQAREADLPVEFAGWVSPWQTLARRGDVLLLPSDAEGFGNVLVEAAAAGVPSVASSSALGVAEAMLPGVTGVLAPSTSVGELTDAVLRAADLRVCDPVVDQWLERFRPQEVAQRLEPVLRAAAGLGDRNQLVTHVGPAPDAQGGIASVLRTYRQTSVPGWTMRFLTSFDSGQPAWSVRPAARVLARVATSGPRSLGLVHVHLSQRGSFLREGAVAATASLRRIPVVITVHGSDFAGFLSKHPGLVARVLARADAIVLLAERHRTLLPPALQGRAVLVPNTVREDAGATTPVPTARRVLFAGELSTRKGVDVLLQAWPRVRAVVPEAELVLAGPVRDVAPPAVDGVRWMGAVDNHEVRELLHRSRVAVLPSRGEAMPMFVLEAMATGRPVVATPVGAVGETVGDGGVIVPVDEVGALAQALSDVLVAPGRAERLGKRARQRFETEFAPQVVLGRLAEVYESARRRRERRSGVPGRVLERPA